MLAKTINIQETQVNLKELLTTVSEDIEIIFTQGNIPIARLLPIKISKTSHKKRIGDKWTDSVKELAGNRKDFPTLEEIRKGMGNDIPRENL